MAGWTSCRKCPVSCRGLLFLFVSLYLVYKKTVQISRTRKSRPTGRLFLLHKHEQDCNFIKFDNWALSELALTIVYKHPTFRQIVRIVNQSVYRIRLRPDLPRRKPRVCGVSAVLWAAFWIQPRVCGGLLTAISVRDTTPRMRGLLLQVEEESIQPCVCGDLRLCRVMVA